MFGSWERAGFAQLSEFPESSVHYGLIKGINPQPKILESSSVPLPIKTGSGRRWLWPVQGHKKFHDFLMDKESPVMGEKPLELQLGWERGWGSSAGWSHIPNPLLHSSDIPSVIQASVQNIPAGNYHKKSGNIPDVGTESTQGKVQRHQSPPQGQLEMDHEEFGKPREQLGHKCLKPGFISGFWWILLGKSRNHGITGH